MFPFDDIIMYRIPNNSELHCIMAWQVYMLSTSVTSTDAHVVVPKHYAQGSSFVILYFVQALTDFTHILLDYFTVTGAIIAPVTVKQPWRIWVIYINWCYNHNEAKQNKNTAYFMRYAIYITWPRKINDWLKWRESRIDELRSHHRVYKPHIMIVWLNIEGPEFSPSIHHQHILFVWVNTAVPEFRPFITSHKVALWFHYMIPSHAFQLISWSAHFSVIYDHPSIMDRLYIITNIHCLPNLPRSLSNIDNYYNRLGHLNDGQTLTLYMD